MACWTWRGRKTKVNKAESLPSRSSPSSRGENDRQWAMPASGKCGKTWLTCSYQTGWFSYIFISQIGGIRSVLHSGLAWIPSWLMFYSQFPEWGTYSAGAFAWILAFLTWQTPPSHAFRCPVSVPPPQRLSLVSCRLSALLSCQFPSHHTVILSLTPVTEGLTRALFLQRLARTQLLLVEWMRNK